MGIAISRSASRVIISHKHILVNGKPMNFSSYQVKKGDVISLKEKDKEKAGFKNIKEALKKYKAPSWLELDVEKLEAKVKADPILDEATPPADLLAIFEFYSK
jgi:small subunit ribosomal protein S4